MKKTFNKRGSLRAFVAAIVALFAAISYCYVSAMGAPAKKEPVAIAVGPDNFIITLDGLKVQKSANFAYQGKKAILLYNGGAPIAFLNICTHKGGPTRLVDNTGLVCKWHGAIFSPLTGLAVKGPAPSGSKLASIGVALKGDKVYINP